MGKILFVDDDPDTLIIYQKAIKLVGHEAIMVDSGEKAITSAINNQPDLIVLDLRLPDINGLMLIKQLRAQKSTVDIPIVMLSASYPHEVANKALATGADVFLSKPMSIKDFFSIIDKYM